jgi:hypothetical protein
MKPSWKQSFQLFENIDNKKGLYLKIIFILALDELFDHRYQPKQTLFHYW